MKKLAIGCVIVLVAGAAVLGIGAFFLYRAASPVIDDARYYLERFSQLADLDKQVKNHSPFSAPSNNELTKVQVDRFVRVQEHVRSSLGRRFDEIEAKYKHLKANTDSPKQPSWSEMGAALREVAGVVIDGRRFQVDALNQTGFSSAEYRWVRNRVYQAAGVEAVGAIDLEKIAEAARKGTGIESIEVPKAPAVDVPARNRELVKPYVAKMDEWLPLAFFGL